MKKQQVDEILFSLKQGNMPVFYFKAARSGLLQRIGTGIIPACEVSFSAVQKQALVFEEILEAIPEHLPATNLYGEAANGTDVQEYVLAFGGGKHTDGQWEFNSRIRIIVDDSSTYTHPLLPVVDMVGNRCEKSTAKLYFDAMIFYAFGARSASLPESTILTGPKVYTEKHKLFSDYLGALSSSGQLATMLHYGKNQTFSDSNLLEYKLESLEKEGNVSIQLIPCGIKGFRTAERTIPKAPRSTPSTPATAGANEGMALQVVSMLTSMRTVFFILMLVCIVYLTFYL